MKERIQSFASCSDCEREMHGVDFEVETMSLEQSSKDFKECGIFCANNRKCSAWTFNPKASNVHCPT